MQGLQLRSLVRQSGELELSLVRVDIAQPGDDEVTILIKATPINPSDIGLLTGPADMSAAKTAGAKENPIVTAPITQNFMRALAGRVGQSLPVPRQGSSWRRGRDLAVSTVHRMLGIA